MGAGDWRARLLASTRGQVVQLLRRSAQTVNGLAARLSLTDNAVRLHVSALERDGLGEQAGTKRESAGKPAYNCRTTAAAEVLFPKPYDRVLEELIDVLEQSQGRERVESLLREVGRRLGSGSGAKDGDLRARAEHAAAILNRLGGIVEVHDEDDGAVRIQGYSCPLSAVTPDHENVCALAESLVSELVQQGRVIECCDRGERPRCAFRVIPA